MLRAPVLAAPTAPTVRRRAITPLDLTLPRSFADDSADNVVVSPSSGEPFHRGLARRLAAERARSADRSAIAANQRTRFGLHSDDYGREAALGEKIKTESGCYELREDPGTGETRWWREACTDTRRESDIVWPPPP